MFRKAFTAEDAEVFAEEPERNRRENEDTAKKGQGEIYVNQSVRNSVRAYSDRCWMYDKQQRLVVKSESCAHDAASGANNQPAALSECGSITRGAKEMS
jgi:hypothetical protein